MKKIILIVLRVSFVLANAQKSNRTKIINASADKIVQKVIEIEKYVF